MECGECTLCCKLLPIKELNKPANELCRFCSNGCTIHDSNPAECSLFECAYFQMKKVHIDLRPDNCKVIFEKISDEVFFGTQDPDFEVTDVAKKQILSFLNQGISVLLSSTKHLKPLLYLSKKHTEEMVDKQIKEYLYKRN